MALFKLCSRIDKSQFQVEVISLTDIGLIGDKIQKLGIPVHAMNLRSGVGAFLGINSIAQKIREIHPDIVQTWMYHSDLIGGIASKIVGVKELVWNIRNSNLDKLTSKRGTIFVMKLSACLSRYLPSKIACCSKVAQDIHVAQGYVKEKFLLIPNGFDLNAYKPDPNAKKSVCEELELPAGSRLIGLVGRYDPQKDHATFIKAASELHKSDPTVYFILCGDRIDEKNQALLSQINITTCSSHFRLLGKRLDTPRLNAAFDIATSSSCYGEAFPNILGEAMACGTPCVATNVGDSALIIGETGRVVPHSDPSRLSNAWKEILSLKQADYRLLSQQARRRVETHFELGETTCTYERMYVSLHQKSHSKSHAGAQK